MDSKVVGISISTPKGIISANFSPDPEFPGLYIKVANQEVVLVEYDSVKDRLMVRVWEKGDRTIDDGHVSHQLEVSDSD